MMSDVAAEDDVAAILPVMSAVAAEDAVAGILPVMNAVAVAGMLLLMSAVADLFSFLCYYHTCDECCFW